MFKNSNEANCSAHITEEKSFVGPKEWDRSTNISTKWHQVVPSDLWFRQLRKSESTACNKHSLQQLAILKYSHKDLNVKPIYNGYEYSEMNISSAQATYKPGTSIQWITQAGRRLRFVRRASKFHQHQEVASSKSKQVLFRPSH